ncbi:protein kinase domain-containing protein [Noviherbaspirillum aerium]|uniref:protein kinase domain-containing protein n=1 Tax=Noviherbaspirillum aerium TaxID=2588497 RepID=UPI00124BDEEA|nr:hypothetical protein [Noviherbaspirillum aerium]
MHEESHQARQAGSSGTHALNAGARIDNAEIVSQIGSSPAAIVYLAREISSGRRIALREYMPHGLAARTADGSVRPSGNTEAEVFAAGLRSFINEALVLSRLSVPSLLSFDRYIELHGTAYAYMPFHEGSTLDSTVAEQDFNPDETWIRMLIARLLDAAEAAQRVQSCHGNIHPGNILIRPDGTPLLLEFDTAQATIGEIIRTPTGILLTGYAAVEQHFNARERNIGAWTDIYAIGATAYFLVTGHPPPYAMQRLSNEGMLPALAAARGSRSRGLLAAIGRALAIHPEHRFQSIAEMRAALAAEREIVLPEAPSILRADNGRAAMQSHRESMTSAAHAAAGTASTQAEQVTRINPGTMHAPLAEAQEHALPALPDNWRKAVPAEEPRFGRPHKKGRSALWMSGLMLMAGASVGLGAGYLHFIGDDNTPAAEAAEGRPQQFDAQQRQDTQVAAVTPGAAAPAAIPPRTEPAAPARNSESKPSPATPASPAPAAAPASPTASTAPAAPSVSPAAKLPQPPLPLPSSPAGTASAAKAGPTPDTNDAARLAAQEQEQWRIAGYVDQPVSYETYLKRYPNGRYADAAREKLASMQARPEQRQAATAAPAEASERPSQSVASAAASSAAAASPGRSERTERTERTEARAAAGGDEDRQAPSAAREDDSPAPPVAASGNSRVIRLDGQTMTGSFTADPSSGVVSGSGRIEWSNGDRFDGTLVRGSKEGKGQFVWRNGQRYSGDWSGNEPNGRGTIVFANGNRYDGDVRNGLPNGRGTLVFADKTRYEGDVRSGVPNGKGTMTFPDGTRYEGDVRNGVPHGQGVTRFKNGDVYVGTVAQGRSNGHGRFSWSNGTAWEGEFRDGQRTENGKLLTAMSRSAMSSGSPGGASDGNASAGMRDETVTK